MEFFEEETAELYNLREDIGEQTDLSERFAEKKAHLVKLLRGWRERVGAQMPKPNPNYRTGARGRPEKP